MGSSLTPLGQGHTRALLKGTDTHLGGVTWQHAVAPGEHAARINYRIRREHLP